MAKKESSLSSFVDPSEFEPEIASPNDYIDVPIIIKDYSFRPGRFGEYVVFTADTPSSKSPVTISTGAKSIVAVFNKLNSDPNFSPPLSCTIRKRGNAYYLTD